ncbi:MAG: 2-hydroxychromene-2-carboxylate isomerase [Bacteriovoracaceae bacterium]|jgi:2-hydroxychromene-2-carboxylate isomerase
MKQVKFYFDYLSPFSYFAWKNLATLKQKHDLQIDYYPTPLGPLLNHWGIKGPGEVTPKREFLLKTCLRYAAKKNWPFTTPKTHPFNSLYALRLSLKEVAEDIQPQVIKCLWEAGWNERIDMGEPDELLGALKKSGLPADELYEKSFSREAKHALKKNIAEATEQGIFGVPSLIVDNELFWGNDSLEDFEAFIKNEDRLDREKLISLLSSTPRAAMQSL